MTANDSKRPNLHDATLKRVEIDWVGGTCTLQLRTLASNSASLVFSGVSKVEVPRTQPWGRSVSINAFEAISDQEFIVEMQSGDVLRIAAKDWSFS